MPALPKDGAALSAGLKYWREMCDVYEVAKLRMRLETLTFDLAFAGRL